MADIKKYLDQTGLSKYDEKIKKVISDGDVASLQSAKDYADSLADNYDAAGVAETKVQELANGAVKSNTDAIATLNGDASTVGSVAKAVADAKALVDADVDSIEEDIGEVDGLSTTNKTVVGAINEVLAAVGTGGTAAVVTVEKSADGLTYTIKQGEATVGTIDIPKDMVVTSGEVVTNPEGQDEGTYIKLTLANVADPLYINVGNLVDIYKAKEGASQVQVAIDSATREISATIVAGSIGTTELVDGAITTVKIADANVTLAKLSTSVQASLAKADAAAPQTKLDEEVQARKDADAALDTRIVELEKVDHSHSNATVLDGITAEKVTAWDAAEGNAKAHATGLNTAMDARVKELEEAVGEGGSVDTQIGNAIADLDADVTSAEVESGKGLRVQVTEVDGKVKTVAVSGNFDNSYDAKGAADTAKSEAIASASADATAKANQAETNAKAEVTALANGAVKTNTDAIADNAQAIADIQAAMPTAITNAQIDELFATV